MSVGKYGRTLKHKGEKMQTESGKSILLVEDMAIIAMAEASTLKKNGFNVIIAYNGNEAIRLASENPTLDLILMDIDLGKGMDGTEAAQIILKTHDIPIVFLSNHTEKEIVEKTEKITSYGYVVKNSGETVLLASIKMAFKLFEAHQLRFESEKKLLESDKKFQILEKQIDDVIWTMDMNFRFTYISPSVEKMHGYTVDEMMKLNLQDYLTEESAQKAIDVLGEEISSYLKDRIEKNIVTIEIDQRKKDGTIFHTEIRARFLLDEQGLPSGMIGVSRDISQRYLAEKALRDSEKALSLALEGAQIGLWDQNFKTGTVVRSNLWAAMLGYQPEELDRSLDFWKSHIHPEDLQTTLYEAKKHEEGLTEFFKVRHRLRCKNGNYKWILNWGKISERDESGKPVRALGIHLDIDENKQIEESLKLSEERLRYALEGNSDGIWDWNLKTSVVYFSPRYYTMLGYQPNEFLPSYNKWKELMHPDDFIESEAAVLFAIEKLNSFSIEFRLRKKDGCYCWILARGKVAEKDGDGKALRISGSHTDINERKLSEEALKKNENKLNSIFKAAPIGIGVTSNRILLEVNDSMCKMLGYNCNELIGNSALMLYPTKEEYDFVGNEKYEQIKKYGTGTVETKWIRKDGKIIDVLLSSTPLNLKDISGGVTFTALDISERKLAEELLRASEANLNSLVNNRNEAIWSIDANYNFIFLNEYFKQEFLKAFNIELKMGMNAFSILTLEQTAFWKPKYDSVLSGEHLTFRFSNQINNELKFYEATLNPIISDGKVIGVSALSQEITSRKKAEEEVLFRKEELERFEKIVVGRELKMIELKEKLIEMEQRLKEYQKNGN